MRRGATGRRMARWTAATMLAGAITATSASGHEMTVYSCHDPAGNAVGVDGWSGSVAGGPFLTYEENCAAAGDGAMTVEVGAAGYPSNAGAAWSFQAPAWASITSYTLRIADSYARPSSGSGEGEVGVEASDEADPIYDYRNLGAGELGAFTVARTPGDAVSSVYLNAACDGWLGSCPAGATIAKADMSSATIVLHDPTSPTITSVTGALQPGASLTGEAEVDVGASDTGPGVYSAMLTVDGTVESTRILNENDGWCHDLGQTSDGTRAFAHPDPCPQSASGSLALNTAALADGPHTVELSVDDASGNSTIAYDGTITTHNSPPRIVTPDPPTGTGTGIANGSAASESAHLTLIGRSAITRYYRGSAMTLHGALTNSNGTPIGGAALAVSEQTADGTTRALGQARTQSDGTFTAAVTGGPSRRIEVSYRAHSGDNANSASAQVSETVRAAVSLRITPTRIPAEGTITLSGQVAGTLPTHGVIVELLVHYRGRWEPFRTPRTNRHGRFDVGYRFQGAEGTFPFRAEVLGGQAGFPYATGVGATVTVRTR